MTNKNKKVRQIKRIKRIASALSAMMIVSVTVPTLSAYISIESYQPKVESTKLSNDSTSEESLETVKNTVNLYSDASDAYIRCTQGEQKFTALSNKHQESIVEVAMATGNDDSEGSSFWESPWDYITRAINDAIEAAKSTFAALIPNDFPTAWGDFKDSINNFISGDGTFMQRLSQLTTDIGTISVNSIANAQETLNGVLGAGGYSNTQLYSAINDISQIKADIKEYMDIKYLTEKDIDMMEVAMYLSQTIKFLDGNLLNTVAKLEETTDSSSLDDTFVINEHEYTYRMLCDYIKANYFVTPVYLSTDGSEFSQATLKDLFDGGSNHNYRFYIQDTLFVPSGLEGAGDNSGTNAMDAVDTTDANAVAEASTNARVSVATSLGQLVDGNSSYLPFLDKTLTDGSCSSVSLTNLTLTPADAQYCILSGSQATLATLNILAMLYTESLPNFSLTDLKGDFGDKMLKMDSFGNILCGNSEDDTYVLVMNALQNPTLMASDGNEKVNTAEYNFVRLYTGNGATGDNLYVGKNYKSEYKQDPEGSKWMSHFFNKSVAKIDDSENGILVSKFDINLLTRPDDKTLAGDKTQAKIFKQTYPEYTSLPNLNYTTIACLYTAGSTSVSKFRGANFNAGSFSFFTSTLLPEDCIGYLDVNSQADTRNYLEKTATFKVSNFIHGTYDYDTTYYTAPELKQYIHDTGRSFNSAISLDSAGIKGILGMYLGYNPSNQTTITDFNYLSETYMFDSTRWADEQTQLDGFRSEIPTWLTSLNDSDANRTGATDPLTKFSPSSNFDPSNTDFTATNTAGECKGNLLKIGAAWKNANGAINDVEVDAWKSMTFYDTMPMNYQDLAMAILKNTYQKTNRLQSMAKLSESDLEELKEEKSVSIIDKIYFMQNNPITTALRYIAGFFQSIHEGLTSGSLATLFYITQADLNSYLMKLPLIFFVLAMILLIIKIAVLATQVMFDKRVSFVSVLPGMLFQTVLVIAPIIIITLYAQLIGWTSDKVLSPALSKYSSSSLARDLKERFTDVDTSDTRELSDTASYFLQSFTHNDAGKVTIKQLPEDYEGVVTESSYENVAISEITPLAFSDIMSQVDLSQYGITTEYDNKYLSKLDANNAGNYHFQAALGSKYSQSIYYYFLDYYMNLYLNLDATAAGTLSSTEWQDDLQKQLNTSTNTFRSYYARRQIAYGKTAGVSSVVPEIADIFGLGMLFYMDDETPATRGYVLPIEYMDTAYHDEDSNETTSNAYWAALTSNKVFKQRDVESVKQKLTLQGVDGATAYVLANKPVYNYTVLSELRPTLKSKAVLNPVVSVDPVIIAGQDIQSYYAIPSTQFTYLEQRLWKTNAAIYKDVAEYFANKKTDSTDYVDLIQLALISTFEFNKIVSQDNAITQRPTMEPISLDKSNLTLDVMLKAMFHKQEYTKEYDLMYDLVLNDHGFFIGLFLIIFEILLTVFTLLRTLHLIIIYCVIAYICIFIYAIRKDLEQKAWLGVLAQGAGLLVPHVLLLSTMTVITLVSNSTNTLVQTLFAGILVAVAIFCMLFEANLLIFALRNITDLGGQMVQAKLTEIKDTLSHRIDNLNADKRLGLETENVDMTQVDRNSDALAIDTMDAAVVGGAALLNTKGAAAIASSDINVNESGDIEVMDPDSSSLFDLDDPSIIDAGNGGDGGALGLPDNSAGGSSSGGSSSGGSLSDTAGNMAKEKALETVAGPMGKGLAKYTDTDDASQIGNAHVNSASIPTPGDLDTAKAMANDPEVMGAGADDLGLSDFDMGVSSSNGNVIDTSFID